jgi:hypothetical protein
MAVKLPIAQPLDFGDAGNVYGEEFAAEITTTTVINGTNIADLDAYVPGWFFIKCATAVTLQYSPNLTAETPDWRDAVGAAGDSATVWVDGASTRLSQTTTVTTTTYLTPIRQ